MFEILEIIIPSLIITAFIITCIIIAVANGNSFKKKLDRLDNNDDSKVTYEVVKMTDVLEEFTFYYIVKVTTYENGRTYKERYKNFSDEQKAIETAKKLNCMGERYTTETIYSPT